MKTYFNIQELIPRHLFAIFGLEKSWNFVNKRAFENLVKFREYVGKPMIINDCFLGGIKNWSGLRTAGSPYFKSTSQHSFGNAYDIISPDITPEELQEIVKEKYKLFEIGGLEVNVGWLHVDWRYDRAGELSIFTKG